MKAPLPINEAERLEALHQYALLDTPPEEVFDCVTQLATSICQTPIAMISLVDEARQWFKSRVGIDVTETPREVAFCAHAILEPDLFLVPDATQDVRFADNPLVTKVPKIRFYAGMPLITPEGHALGTLCVMDRAPRELEPWQAQSLRALARQALVQIELGRSYKDLQQAEKALRESQEMFSTAFRSSPGAMVISTMAQGRYVDVNESFLHFTGHSREEVIGKTSLELNIWADPQDRHAFLGAVQKAGGMREREFPMRTKAGEIRFVQLSTTRIEVGGEACLLTTVEDVTDRKRADSERKRLEEQLRQSQKMEAVGRLAGGIAHDFNNLLTVIQGHCELQSPQLRKEDPLRHTLDEIQRAAERAASLTRQLLAFSRQQVIQPQVLDFNHLIAEVRGMLERLIGEDITLEYKPAGELGSVRADPGLLQQVVLNLAVNARDAMPYGGRLLIETANANLDEAYIQAHAQAAPGQYVMLAVSDTGTGMDAATQSRLFEPFFTTKAIGKGTGLGLATVYGIVKQSGGFIHVYSELGKGSTFKIYLPLVEGAAEPLLPRTQQIGASRGTEAILLVEDEDALRKLLFDYLRMLRYTVVSARDGNEALALCAGQGTQPQLLITDVVMPGISGRELGEKLLLRNPGMKVLYLSGYTDEAILRHGILPSGMFFLQKPIQLAALSNKIREILDGKSSAYKALTG